MCGIAVMFENRRAQATCHGMGRDECTLSFHKLCRTRRNNWKIEVNNVPSNVAKQGHLERRNLSFYSVTTQIFHTPS